MIAVSFLYICEIKPTRPPGRSYHDKDLTTEASGSHEFDDTPTVETYLVIREVSPQNPGADYVHTLIFHLAISKTRMGR